ncbi:MAG: glycosyltransferase family 4 protein [bacterium]
MRVLFYLGDKLWSGSARATLAGARGLAVRGHQITVACCEDARLERLAREAGIETVVINSSSSAAGGAWDLRKVLQDRFIEVAVVGNERDHLIVGSAMRFAERGGVLRRVPSFGSFELQRSGKLALKLASSGLVVSTQQELTDAAGTRWVIPATVAPIGVNVDSYDAVEPITRLDLSVPAEGLLIACSYDPSGRYRMATVFRTLALMAQRNSNMRVVVFGEGSADDDLRMHAAALGVGSLVGFLGEREDELRLMRAAHAGWVVSSGDNGAFACLDFMAQRIPVIAERSPLTQHFIAHNITGLLVSGGDTSLTTSAVAAFFSNEEKRVAMGNAGRTRVQREFTETVMDDGFERAVNEAGDRGKWVKV